MAQEMMMQAEEAGRGTDTVLAHLSLGEVVIPRAFLDDPQVMQVLQQIFQAGGADMAQYTVGDPANSINPETGYPEFGFFKSIKRVFKKAAPFLPLALNFVPGLQGIGTALGSSILGAGAAGASTLGNALIGGGIGALSGGGLKSAGIGALTGGLSANIGSLPGTNNLPWLPAGLQNGAVESGSGLLGALGRSTGLTSGAVSSLTNQLPSIGGLVGGSQGGGSSYGGLASALGGIYQDSSLKKQQKQLLGANQQQLANLESFDPSGITEDPGYQFNLEQGQQGLNRSLAAGGSLFSGKALKAASQYNQNYADNAFKDYYNRWLQKTGAQNQLYGAGGDIRANATGAKSQNLAQSLSNVFGSKVGNYGGIDPAILQLLRLQGGNAYA